MSEQEQKFIPKPGQIDFTTIRWAPVINCVVRFENRILLVHRSEGMRLYPGYWNGVSGFLDDHKSLEEKVTEELREEVGVEKNNILEIKLGQIFDQDEPLYNKTWIVHPVLVTINTDAIKTDWEAQNYKWVKPEELTSIKLLPGFDNVLKAFSIL